MREAQGYILGWALEHEGMEAYAFCLNVTHEHAVVGHPADWSEPARNGSFYARLHLQLSRLTRLDLSVVCDWTGPVWELSERTSSTPILDEESERRKVVYTMAQGVSDEMVERPEDFPGLNFLPHHIDEPEVFERNALIEALDPGRTVFTEDSYSVRLEIPPHNRHYSRSEYRAMIEEELAQVCARFAEKRERTGERAPGRSAYFRTRFGRLKGAEELAAIRRKFRGPAPVTHTRYPEREIAYRKMRRDFYERHEQASALFRSGAPGVVFPAGTFGWFAVAAVEVELPSPLPWSVPPP